MRKTLLFLLLLCTNLTFGQFRDDFSDGNFNANPIWNGQTAQFSITADKKLKTSLSAVAQTISLFTASNLALNVKWEFSIQLNFDPSTTNFSRVYLIADNEELKADLNGYFIQIGENGSTDSYDLYKQNGKSVTKILDCPAKNRVNINYLSTKLRVTRDEQGRWQVLSALPNSDQYQLEGSVVDLSFTNTSYFGVYAKYTATRSDGFTFDDFSVTELVADIIPPSLTGIKIMFNYVEATFSEALLLNTALHVANYTIKELSENPTLVATTNKPNVFLLHFAKPFESASYTLTVEKLKDLKGNELTGSMEVSSFFVKPYVSKRGDVMINEIFADPSPSVGLPQAEFVELWNTTNNYIIVTGWKYGDLSSTVTLLPDTLKPNGYLIISAVADAGQFAIYGKTMGLMAWPSLNNDADKLSLWSSENVLIDEVFYAALWYKEDTKSKGGYSLELIDPENNCVGIQNWQASIDPSGGTPGRQNAVYRQQINNTAPRLTKLTLMNETTATVYFDKSLDSLSLSIAANYYVNNGVGSPVGVTAQGPYFSSVKLEWAAPIVKGIEHTLTINGLYDCAGNSIDQTANTGKIFFSKEILVNELLISEVLVNPKIDGVDFIEIYNNSIDVKDLSTLKLASVDANGNVFNAKTISNVPIYIPPKTYWVLTTDVALIKRQYLAENPANFTQVAAMPSYTNEKGTIILTTAQEIIDRFDYRENMHLPLLQIVKGVSLERVSFQKKTNEAGNFSSAAQTTGFATPSYQNSQHESTANSNRVWLSHKVFSPDADGRDDLLLINFELVNHEHLATISIFNESGGIVKQLIKQSTIPKVGYVAWDGLNDRGSLSDVGIYLIKLTFVALNGKVENFERVCVLAAKLE